MLHHWPGQCAIRGPGDQTPSRRSRSAGRGRWPRGWRRGWAGASLRSCAVRRRPPPRPASFRCLSAVATSPFPSGLVRTRRSPGLAAALVRIRRGSTRPVTASPYLSSSSTTRVPADDDRAGFVDRVVSALQHCRQHFEREAIGGIGDDVERRERLAAHGVDVGKRVRRRDAAERVGIVDDWGEEVHRLDQREVIAELERHRRRRTSPGRRAAAGRRWRRGAPAPATDHPDPSSTRSPRIGRSPSTGSPGRPRAGRQQRGVVPWMWRACDGRWLAVDRGHEIDLDQDVARESSHLDRRSGRSGRAQDAPIHVVHRRKVAHVSQDRRWS